MPRASNRLARFLYAAAIVAATLVVYAPVGEFDFINYDDELFVSENPAVLAGLSAESVRWAWTTTHGGIWMPLTWMSHMLDVELFGVDPGAHHRVNVAIHAATGALLFLVLAAMTGADRPSAFVAGVFALHPLHVESVAWIAERKDVLSGLFWVATMGAYAAWVRRPGAARYAAVALSLALGLMAKPMLVTLPFALLLLDVWPLRRIERLEPAAIGGRVREKIPLFLLAAAGSVVAFLAQRAEGAVTDVGGLPLDRRLATAVAAYARYVVDFFRPVDLAVLYPYESSTPIPVVVGSLLLVVAVTVLAVLVRRWSRAPIVGWLWYLGTLVPVIGLVQIGAQARADRYTYIPAIGLTLVLAWGLPALLPRRPAWRAALAIAGVLSLVACAWFARAQVSLWRDSETLYRHTLAVTRDNHRIAYNLGVHLADEGRDREAIDFYREALRIKPDWADAWFNLGNALTRAGRRDEALDAYRNALEAAPGDAGARERVVTLSREDGTRALRERRYDDAAAAFRETLRHAPDDVVAATSLAWVLLEHPDPARRDPAAALRQVESAASLAPDDPMVLLVRATCYARLGRDDEARLEARRAEAAGRGGVAALARKLLDELEGAGRR